MDNSPNEILKFYLVCYIHCLKNGSWAHYLRSRTRINSRSFSDPSASSIVVRMRLIASCTFSSITMCSGLCLIGAGRGFPASICVAMITCKKVLATLLALNIALNMAFASVSAWSLHSTLSKSHIM